MESTPKVPARPGSPRSGSRGSIICEKKVPPCCCPGPHRHAEQRRRDADPRLRRLPGPCRGDRARGRQTLWPSATACSIPPPPTATKKRSAAPSRPAASLGRSSFVTTKLWVQDAGYEETPSRRSRRSLDRLGLDYLDLYLIHQPYGDVYGAWRAMEGLNEPGRAEGHRRVSNFYPDRLVDYRAHNEITPAVNQIEIHPFYQRADRQASCLSTAFSPKPGGPSPKANNLFSDSTLSRNEAHGKTVAQVVLRWLSQRDIVAIPKSVRPERMAENLAIFDFEPPRPSGRRRHRHPRRPCSSTTATPRWSARSATGPSTTTSHPRSHPRRSATPPADGSGTQISPRSESRVCRRAVTIRGHDLALEDAPLTAHGHRQILPTRTQSDLICAPRLLIAEQPPTVQIGGFCAAREDPGLLSVTGFPSASVLGWQSSRLPTDHVAWPRSWSWRGAQPCPRL